jgi:thiol-disulfide isomerase/thioredoxin
MTVFNPQHDSPALAARLTDNPEGLVVACYCAAWCGTCRDYADTFATVAAHFPQVRFEWIDIEEDERFAEVEVESFPTVAVVRDGKRLFEGTLLPHGQHLKRLVETLLAE